MKTVVERTEILDEADGSYALLIVRLDDGQEILMEASEAGGELASAAREELIGGSLYAILGQDNVPILCDFELLGLSAVRNATVLRNSLRIAFGIVQFPDFCIKFESAA